MIALHNVFVPARDSNLIARLLGAWRGEIEAGAIYELLAERETNKNRKRLIRELARAEVGHRNRIESRLRELGVEIPDIASIRLSPWTRLQARFAPLERVLVAREAAEDREVGDGYGRPSGDDATDKLFAELQRDEQSHSEQLRAMRAPNATAGELSALVQLDRILSRERWHQRGGGWIGGAIYGANDGLAAVFGIVTGVSGATGGSSFVLTAGLAGALASALSMATGAFLAEKSRAEVAEANLARERQEIRENSAEEKEELALFYQLKGLNKPESEDLVEKISRDPDAFLQAMATEELGGLEGGAGHPLQAALAAGISTALGAIIPVIPFFWLNGTAGVLAAAVISLIAHFLVGASKSLVTLRTWWAAGLEMTVAGAIVGTVTYTAGLLFQIGRL